MRVVLDASACVELLFGTAQGRHAAAVLGRATSIHAPELLVSEVLSACRGAVRGGRATDAEARLALRALGALECELVPAGGLLDAIWTLSLAHSPYDAHYVALAALIGATLLTADARLARGALTVPVELV